MAAAAFSRRLETARPYLRALLIYLASRLVVAIGLSFGRIYLPPGNAEWLGGPRWYHRLLRWDSEWYSQIATSGYAYSAQSSEPQNVAFYPLYPLLTRGLALLTGLGVPDAMLLISNLAAMIAVLLLFRLARDECGEPVALSTVALLGFFPGAIFLSAGYTEPLALLWMVGFFLALRQQRFFCAAVLAGLAVATRSSGIVLLPVLVWELWRQRPARTFARDVVPLVIIASAGLWLYVIYLGIAFGHPLAFSDAQSAFHQHTTMAARLVGAVTLQPFWKIGFPDASPASVDQWVFVVALALLVRAWFRLSSAMTLFAAGVLLLPYLTLSGGPAGFTSMARFNVVSFPLFLAAAELIERARWLLPAVIGVLGALLLLFAALFAQGQWAG